MLRAFINDYIFGIAKIVFVAGFYFCGVYLFANTGDPLWSFCGGGITMYCAIVIADKIL